jgi:hypothetical protein
MIQWTASFHHARQAGTINCALFPEMDHVLEHALIGFCSLGNGQFHGRKTYMLLS